LPNRDAFRGAPPPPGFPVRCIVRINEHGSKDRVKDASRSACNGVPCLRPVPTRIWRRTTSFPSWASFGHPLSPARSIPAEEAACTDHEPTKAFVPTTHREACRLPENRDAFCRHDTRGILFARRDCSLRPSRRLSRSRRPHFFPRLGRVLWLGLASVTVRSPAIRNCPPAGGSRVLTPFVTPVVMPGTDDPSMPGSSTDSAVDGG
jgi:hypothetical protein